MEQAAVGTRMVSSTIAAVDETARQSDQSDQAAQIVLTDATQLAEQVQGLKGATEAFLTEIRRDA